MSKLSHVAATGSVSMVDVRGKAATPRVARAQADVRMSAEARSALKGATLAKGDAFVAAQIAGILAAKGTASLIPLAHPIPLSSIDVTFHWAKHGILTIQAVAHTSAQTGVEMEAMVAVSIAALTIYDMTKAVDKAVVIETVRLLEKSGGKSGAWKAP
ncbi:MAG: cyclic pyranopterin monophosphate synthase MoaC [Candidatus Eremiobacteraeota bacterium]|nr:cyclic pyranopterin monophosphate synthase MoaC [Candidatus Eremiobacteraeota bacterium]